MAAPSLIPMETLFIASTTMIRSAATRSISWIFEAEFLLQYEERGYRFVGCWYGYRLDSGANEEKPWFQVKQYGRLFCMGSFACQVTVGLDKYWVVKLGSKQAFRIVNIDREVIAEVKQKQSSSGISMGEDVLTLAVEPHVDHSLIMAIVTVHGLINYKL
ncbi:hypothetical protein OIU78_013796 [Salix suchowensis]|nr:hypothetical protein OIU78_013796 [Salix suchowensis]